MKLLWSDRKELQELSGIIFIWPRPTFTVGIAAYECEIATHHGVERDLLQYVPQIRKGISHEDIVHRTPNLVEVFIAVCTAHHVNLGEDPGCTLTQAVFPSHD